MGDMHEKVGIPAFEVASDVGHGIKGLDVLGSSRAVKNNSVETRGGFDLLYYTSLVCAVI